MLDLAGPWTLSDGGGEFTAPMRLPGDVHSALQAAGLIPDPYHGRNEDGLRWVADRDWTLSRSFRMEAVEGPWLLVADMVDTVAEIRLNGRRVIAAATMFREHAARVEDALIAGENRIEIVLRSATRAADALQARQPFPVPYHAGNCPIPNGNMLRKPQCDFGWDWNIALAPVGVYGRVALVGPEGEIGLPRVRQAHAPGRVTVEVRLPLRNLAAAEADWRVTLAGAEAQGRVALDDGAGTIEARLEIADPALWWPAGSGAQPVHALNVTAGALRLELPLALREVRLVSEPDATGRSFKLVVNGRDVFARGANWIPADALPGRIEAEKTRALLQSAVEANMNMIRVWGGGRYEPTSFYEDCDALGLLVWQDFMFACHLYPATEDFLAEVEREVGWQAGRIGRHVALWCGDNELLGALGWFEESRANRDRYLVAYDRLNRTIEAALKRADPGANWWPSSPSPGPMSFGDTWHDDTSGDMHFWSVWHEGRDFEHYRDVRPRFCSEFGFQSYTSLPVIRSFAEEAELNVASPVMESHQKNAGGNARIAETMFRYFRFPKDFASFVWLSQVQQGLAIKTAVDHWRSLKPHCMGALYWQLNDTWPVASWSSLDYGGGWKLLHHMARRFFQPVQVTAIPADGQFRVTAVNDTAEPVEVEVDLAAAAMDGSTRPLRTARLPVGTDAAAAVTELPLTALGPGEVLVLRWSGSNGMAGGDVVPAVRHKALELLDPKLAVATTVADGRLRAQVSAEALAFFVTLEADRPGRFSTNAVALFPGHPATIDFIPAEGDPDGVTLTPRDLHSSFANT
jgi:beta-mannosidase